MCTNINFDNPFVNDCTLWYIRKKNVSLHVTFSHYTLYVEIHILIHQNLKRNLVNVNNILGEKLGHGSNFPAANQIKVILPKLSQMKVRLSKLLTLTLYSGKQLNYSKKCFMKKNKVVIVR